MKKALTLFLCGMAMFASAQTYNAKDLTIIGKLTTTPTENHYYRVDINKFPSIPDVVKGLFKQPSGMAVLFRTNSKSIKVTWTNTDFKQGGNMTPIVQRGLDLYIKTNTGWRWAGVGIPSTLIPTTTATIVDNMEVCDKECMLYLPLYCGLDKLEITVEEGSTFTSMPSPFKRRIAVYGSSITQGASASRPGLNYTSRLSRETGWEFLNIGLSGAGKMEPAVADMLATLDADAFILDCVPNSNTTDIQNNTAYLVETIRNAHPNAPIIFIHSVMRPNTAFNLSSRSSVQKQNQLITDELNKLLQKGIMNLYLISEDDFLGTDYEGSVDGTHPNDIGFDRFLNKVRPYILNILQKSFNYEEQTTVSTFAGLGLRGFAEGPSFQAKFASPRGIDFDSKGNLIVADNFNHRIRKITPDGTVSTLAGTGTASALNGSATTATFKNPYSVAVDNNDNVYVADFGNNLIRKISPAGVVSTLAGSTADEVDGTGVGAKFKGPIGIAFDRTTNTLVVADYSGHTIRRVTLDGVTTTIAGTKGASGSDDGTGTAAKFNAPTLMVIDNQGNIILPDRGNDIIRKITPAAVVTTIAGKAKQRSFADGMGEEARFNQPSTVVIDGEGNYLVADFGNNRIRKITPEGVVTTITGDGVKQTNDGPLTKAQFNSPYGMVISKEGEIYVSEDEGNCIRRIGTDFVSSKMQLKAANAPGIKVLTVGKGEVEFEFVLLEGKGRLMIVQPNGALVSQHEIDFDWQSRVKLELPAGNYCAILVQGACKMSTTFSVF